jgi:hypothetical protein
VTRITPAGTLSSEQQLCCESNAQIRPAPDRHPLGHSRECCSAYEASSRARCWPRAATPCRARAWQRVCAGRTAERSACGVCGGAGKTASDIVQGSGPYAAALATELVKPGQSDLIMFHNVRVAVVDKTKGDRVPWTEDGIQRRQRVLFGGEVKATPILPMRLKRSRRGVGQGQGRN